MDLKFFCLIIQVIKNGFCLFLQRRKLFLFFQDGTMWSGSDFAYWQVSLAIDAYLCNTVFSCCRYAMSFAVNSLKMMYVKRTPEMNKTLHVVSSAFKATLTWHNMRTLQVVTGSVFSIWLLTDNQFAWWFLFLLIFINWIRNAGKPVEARVWRLKIVLVSWKVNMMFSLRLRVTTMFLCSR